MEGLLKLPFQYLSKRISSSGKGSKAKSIGYGVTDLSVAGKMKAGKSVRLKVPLIAPQDVCQLVRRRSRDDMSVKKRTLLKSGKGNGTAIFSARLYG